MTYRAVLLLTLLAAPVVASEHRIALELNRAEDLEGACRLTFIASNPTEVDVDALTVEAVLFAADGGVASFNLLDLREIPAGRTRVRRFDLPDQSCGSIAGMLVNGVETCETEAGQSSLCDEVLLTSSTAIEARL